MANDVARGELERRVGPAGFTRALLERGERPLVARPIKRRRVPGGAPRVRWIAEALKKDAIGWLCRAGGWRRRQVVVGGRRREARVWDRHVFPRLGVRFTPGPLRLLVAALEADQGVPDLDEAGRARVAEGLTGPEPATGDLLALHRLVTQLEPTGLALRTCPACGALLEAVERSPQPTPPAPKTRAGAKGRAGARREAGREREGRTRCARCDALVEPADEAGRATRARWEALVPLSPLTLLTRPALAGAHPALQDDAALDAALAPLLRGDRAVLLSYLDEVLAAAWIEEERRRLRAPVAQAQQGYAATTRALTALVGGTRARPDALRPLIAFFHRYTLRVFGGRAPVTAALRERAQAFDRASEREAFLRQAAALFALGAAVTEVAERALATPFVDRTEEEKVLLAEFHERFSAVGPEVEAIRRELAGEIG